MSTGKALLQDNPAANVRHGLDLFVGVVKKHAFYPESNPTLQQAFEIFRDWLDPFLQQNGALRIEVERGQLLYQGEVVQQEKASERTVIFPLFRDGVQWFEFMEGVSADELLDFIRLVNKYREQREESENDLVTALWEVDFLNIRHKAVDKFWEAESLISISSLSAGGGAGGKGAAAGPGTPQASSSAAGIQELLATAGLGMGGGWDGPTPGSVLAASGGASPQNVGTVSDRLRRGADDSDGDDMPGNAGEADAARNPMVRMFMAKLEAAQSVSSAPRRRPVDIQQTENVNLFWKLTDAEEEILQHMVAQEEQRNVSKDSLDIILVLIQEQLDDQTRLAVREFVAEEFRRLLGQGDFTYACLFVEQLAAAREAERSGASRFAEEIAGTIADAGVLGTLNEAWQQIRSLPAPAIDNLHRLLLLLPPAAVEPLAPMVARCGDPRLQAMLMDVISHLAAQSRSDVTAAVSAMPATFLCEVIGSYSARRQRPPIGLLTKLLRHREPLVREAAARELIADNPENLKAVFHLLKDPDRNVSRWLLAHMAEKRDPVAERLLLAYLVKRALANYTRDEELLLDCYQALGGCASKASVGYLRRILMKKSWRALLGLERTPHRVGAAMALALMPEEWGAEEVLRGAENSRFVSIRRACVQARQEMAGRLGEADD